MQSWRAWAQRPALTRQPPSLFERSLLCNGGVIWTDHRGSQGGRTACEAEVSAKATDTAWVLGPRRAERQGVTGRATHPQDRGGVGRQPREVGPPARPPKHTSPQSPWVQAADCPVLSPPGAECAPPSRKFSAIRLPALPSSLPI